MADDTRLTALEARMTALVEFVGCRLKVFADHQKAMRRQLDALTGATGSRPSRERDRDRELPAADLSAAQVIES